MLRGVGDVLEVIENALPEAAAETLRGMFIKDKLRFLPVRQEYPGKYEDSFKAPSPEFPGPDEPYSASFWRNRDLAVEPDFLGFCDKYIAPFLSEKFKTKPSAVTLLCYRMEAGDHFRIHADGNSGPLGFVYYLSKGWKWDWGGLLMTHIKGEMVPTLPKFNSMVLTDHRTKPLHLVTEVSRHAREPRYMLVGFLQ